jgi:hypothetical protein
MTYFQKLNHFPGNNSRGHVTSNDPCPCSNVKVADRMGERGLPPKELGFLSRGGVKRSNLGLTYFLRGLWKLASVLYRYKWTAE